MSIVQQYGQLWESSSTPPDVFAFLEQLNSEDPDELLGILLEDQKLRWRTENPFAVEDYLARLLNLPEAVDWKLQLAIGEFEARRATGQPFDAEEISSRFPDLSDTLRERMKQVESARPTVSDDAASALLDELCDRFEAVCTGSDQFPRIEDFLSEYPPAHHRELFIELLQIELWWRRRHGGTPTTSDYSMRFPEYRAEIESLLERSTGGLNISARSADALNFGRVLSPVSANTGTASSRVTYISANGIGEQQKGRYRLDRVLGEGAFGRVYLGFDEDLHRQVAIKVPARSRFEKPEDAEQYLEEARTVAGLDHPNIVPVFDMGRTQDGSVFVVSKFIEGETLRDRMNAGPLRDRECTQIMARIAAALQHAHDRRLVHRDVKPANILLDGKSNIPFLADFGLAIREEDYLRQNVIAGTPAYMSPEQIRGEGHRLDGRSDIFSLGVVLYESLTGRKPFQGGSIEETLHRVITLDPQPPREFIESISAELERICLKALSKRVSDRYHTAAAFADDLEQWLSPKVAMLEATATLEVRPKGLRSFDASDADFFLELLPGPRDRNGLPESLSFWKSRIEETEAGRTFNVGLIYGPSGCGKSSLIKAGLLPHLSDIVIAIYVDATPEDTETRILRGLRKRFPELSEDLGCAEALATLRRGQNSKIVIIIDQFEQWLHAHRAEPVAELVNALRQCDGGRLQSILMVRDDFAVAAARFMRVLDVPIVEGQNFALVDLFDADHAIKVLMRFGQAFGKLPIAVNMSGDEKEFIGRAASGLAQDGKVVAVRLAIFAEMVKSKPWTSDTLKQVGGTQGIGVNFLEETFSSPQSNPNHRRHAVAARGVLRALLPSLGTDIKGHMRSHADLVKASGYRDRPSDFADLIRILDGELRLITPTDREGDSLSDDSSRHSSLATGFYQLTHDYLIPSLRDWLTSKQKESRRGRAELKLEERAALWTARPENRHLPSLMEWLSFRRRTESKDWSVPQRSMMSHAARVHSLRSIIATALLLALIFVSLRAIKASNNRRNQAEATRIVEGLLLADTAKVSDILTSLTEYRTWAVPCLQQAFKDSLADSNAKLHAGLALVAEGQIVDPIVLEFLKARLLTVTPAQFGPVRELLEAHKKELIPSYWKLATDEQQSATRRFHTACALAAYDSDNSQWNDPKFTGMLADELVTVNAVFIGQYQELLRPVGSQLVPALSNVFKDPARGELARTIVTSLLIDYAADDPDTLTDLVLVADAASDKSLFPVLQKHRETAVRNLEVVLDQRLEPDWQDAHLDPAWTEPSASIRACMESAHGMITERFAFCQDMPLATFLEVAESLRASGYRPTKVRPVGESGEWGMGSGESNAGNGELGTEKLTPVMDDAVKAGSSPPTAPSPLPTARVAAIWTRDGKRWHLDASLNKTAVRSPDVPAAEDGLLLCDITPLPLATEAKEMRFLALWSAAASDDERRCVLLDVTESELTAAQTAFSQQGFASQSTFSVRTDASGKRRYTGIWSNVGAPSKHRRAYAGFELVEQPQWDVASAPSERLAGPLETSRQQLAQFEKLPTENLDDPQIREARAAAHYQLGNLEQALADLDFLISKEIVTAPVLQHRTLTLARLGRRAEAEESLTKFMATDASPSYRYYVQIQVPAWLGEYEHASSELESAVAAVGQNTDDLYNVACAAALCSKALLPRDADQSARFADRMFELLRQMVAQGYNKADQLKGDADFASLHADQRFTELLSQLEPPATYAALWRADVEYESRLLTGIRVDRLLDELKPLLAQGYRPFAIAVNSGPSRQKSGKNVGHRLDEVLNTPRGSDPNITADREESNLHCSLVLHRPLIPDSAKESLALQQSAAATVLLRLNATDKVWPLFQDQPDPRLRSYLLHRLADFGVDPQSLFTQLQQVSDVSHQRSLILGLGEFARAKLLSPEQKTAATADLATRYADHPDSGIHGAAEWTLRQLREFSPIQRVHASLSSGTVEGSRQWYLTKTTGRASLNTAQSSALSEMSISLSIIDPDKVFTMGSSVSEAERAGGPVGDVEIRHRRHINRRYAIGMHEVTVAQFRLFRPDHNFDATIARTDDAPQIMVTMYDAMEYCNWLSQQEGIPRDEWCYNSEEPFDDGMSPIPDYLRRTGYRLPSEAEWEYACRCGSTTSRYYGESESLMGDYCWYTTTSADKCVLAVGMLRPNPYGLFDMQGNVLEWCQNTPFYYKTETPWMDDSEESTPIVDGSVRVLRGGSFLNRASLLRSAHRNSGSPRDRHFSLGFRVARTMPQSLRMPM